MQATIRLDRHKGRDCGSIIVTDADVFQEPVFYSLQRFTDGKFLCPDAVWRTGKDELRADDFEQRNGVLTIAVGRDILYELDEDTSYRMSINSSKSFPLVVERQMVRALQGKAALEAYAENHPATVAGKDEGEADTQDRSSRSKGSGAKANSAPKGGASLFPIAGIAVVVLLCAGLAASLIKKNQFFQVEPRPISVTSPLDADAGATGVGPSPVAASSAFRNAVNGVSSSASNGVQNDASGSASLQNAQRADKGNFADTGERFVNALSSLPFFSTGNFEDQNGSHLLQDGGVMLDELEYLSNVHDYLQSGVTTPAMNVTLAKKARYVGASGQESDTAFMLLQDAADKGNVEAMFLVGQYYDPLCQLPRGSVATNPLQAREWYKRAEAGGLLNAYLSSNALFHYLQKRAGEGEQDAVMALSMW